MRHSTRGSQWQPHYTSTEVVGALALQQYSISNSMGTRRLTFAIDKHVQAHSYGPDLCREGRKGGTPGAAHLGGHEGRGAHGRGHQRRLMRLR